MYKFLYLMKLNHFLRYFSFRELRISQQTHFTQKQPLCTFVISTRLTGRSPAQWSRRVHAIAASRPQRLQDYMKVVDGSGSQKDCFTIEYIYRRVVHTNTIDWKWLDAASECTFTTSSRNRISTFLLTFFFPSHY